MRKLTEAQVDKIYPTKVEVGQYMAEIISLRNRIGQNEVNERTAATNAETYKKNYDHLNNRIMELQETVIKYRDRLIEVEARLIVELEKSHDERHAD